MKATRGHGVCTGAATATGRLHLGRRRTRNESSKERLLFYKEQNIRVSWNLARVLCCPHYVRALDDQCTQDVVLPSPFP